MIKPVGDWKQIFTPSKNSKYVNDHTIFVDKSGKYRLLGTASSKNYTFFRERFFIEAVSDKIDGKYLEDNISFQFDPHPGVKIAPFVIFSEPDKKFHLFFGPGKISHYISDDGRAWKYFGVAIKTIWPLTRDPFVLKHNNKFIMYLTGSNNRIITYESADLNKWKYIGSALKLGRGAPASPNSACESSTVIYKNDKFYLFTTIVPALIGTKQHYNNTLIFESNDPFNFGSYHGVLGHNSSLVGSLEAHAPEIIVANNKIFYTTCGWPKMPKPDGVCGDGVCMRELKID